MTIYVLRVWSLSTLAENEKEKEERSEMKKRIRRRRKVEDEEDMVELREKRSE